MRKVTLLEIYNHPIAQKYLNRSGMAHAIAVAHHAFKLSKTHHVHPDIATKAGFLHDIGHYTWYTNGQWDYDMYKKFDIHPLKGAERAHKLLIRLGDDPQVAKDVSLAILFHTDSLIPDGSVELNPLQKIVTLADDMDKEPNHNHHYRQVDKQKEVRLLEALDMAIDDTIRQMAIADTHPISVR